MEIVKCEKQKEKRLKKNKQNLSNLWDTIRWALWESQKEKRKKGTERVYEEIMTEISPNSMKDINTDIQEAQPTSSKMNSKRSTLRYIIIKLIKNKRENLESSKRSKSLHTRDPLFSVDYSSESLEARRQWTDIFKVLGENCQLRILYLRNSLAIQLLGCMLSLPQLCCVCAQLCLTVCNPMDWGPLLNCDVGEDSWEALGLQGDPTSPS